MVDSNAELLTYARGPFSASVSARASAEAEASGDLRRGVRASIGAEASTDLVAKLEADPDGTTAAALVRGQAGVAIGAAFAAQLDVHGLWAEARIRAEGRARIQGDISVSGATLLSLLDGELPDVLYRPAAALLSKTRIHAGVFAEAYFAVKLQARLLAGGSLIPTGDADRQTGFTVEFQYGYAYIFGAGVNGYVDFEFPDGGEAVDAVVKEVLLQITTHLPAGTSPDVVALLRLLLPLAGSVAVAVGRTLGAPQPEMSTTTAVASQIIPTFLGELRVQGLGLVLRTVVDAAMNRALTAVAEALQAPNPAGFPDAAKTIFTDARMVLGRLDAAGSLVDALPHLLALCGDLAALGEDATDDVIRRITSAASVAGVAGTVLLSLLGKDAVATFPDTLTRRVNRSVRPNVPDTTAVTVVVLAEYLGAESGLLTPDAKKVVNKVSTLLGTTPEALIRFLWELGSDGVDTAATATLARGIVDRLAAAASGELRPFLESQPSPELKELAAYVQPLFEVAEMALPPLIAAGGNLSDQDARRLRDQLDTQLTQLFGSVVVRIMDKIIRPYFARGAMQLRELADRVDRRDPAFADFFALANQVSVVFRINETIVAEALRETANILALVESSGFDSAVKLLRSFILLSADTTERRAQLAALAGSDGARMSDGQLRTQLLEAMVVDSHKLALGMIPPSLRMSTLIAVEQGPLPLVTLYNDAKAVAVAYAASISDLAQVGADVVGLVARLIATGKVRAEELRALGADLKRFIHDVGDIVRAVLKVLKDALWPLFVASTGGFGFLLSKQYDEFFDGAAWIVDRVEAAVSRLADALVEAVIDIARNLGALDAGSGPDMGHLEQQARLRAMGDPNQEGVTIQLGPGSASVSHAQLATDVANAAFGKAEVRDRIREIHAKAAEQAADATRIDQLRRNQQTADAKLSELRALQVTTSLPTGTAIDVVLVGLETGAEVPSEHVFAITLPGLPADFALGGKQVRVEIGGQQVVIDPRTWHLDRQGTPRCLVTLVCQPTPTPARIQVAPNAVVGVIAGASGASAPDAAGSTVLGAVQDAIARMSAEAGGPTMQFFLRAGGAGPSPRAPIARDFLPRAMQDGAGPDEPPTPTVLTLRRASVLENAAGPDEQAALQQLPGSPDIAVVASTDLPTVGALLTAEARLAMASGAVLRPPPGVPASTVAIAPPGYVPITVCVYAVPGDGQNQTTTPHTVLTTWCVLAPPVPQPALRTTVFDPAFYLRRYTDLSAAFGTDQAKAQQHWLANGIGEGRRGCVVFDAAYYLAHYPDLSAAFGTDHTKAIEHWITFGIGEGRRGCLEFDVRHYLDSDPRLAARFGSDHVRAIEHWLVAGIAEGRRGSADFDVRWYLARYPDLSAAFGTDFRRALEHWIIMGIGEGRDGVPRLGTADVVGFGSGGVVAALSNGDGTFGASHKVLDGFAYDTGGWRIEKHPRLLADLTGDGRADVVGFGNDGVWVALNNGDGRFASARKVLADFAYDAGGWRIEKHLRFLADVTGDGRADIVGFGSGGVMVSLNNGDGTFGASHKVLDGFAYDTGGWRIEKHPRLLADLTGDGRADVVGFGNGGVWVALNNGDGRFASARKVLADFAYDAGGWRIEKHLRFLADVTGDGRADIVGFGSGGVMVSLNNGDGTFGASHKVLDGFAYDTGGWRIEKHPRLLADLTGDGRADVVGFGNDGVWVALNNGDGTFGASHKVLDGFAYDTGGWRIEKHPRLLADLTGDGRADVVGFGNDGVWVALNNGDGRFASARKVLGDFAYDAGGWRTEKHLRFLAEL